VASFHNSSAQVLRLRGVLILVSSYAVRCRVKIQWNSFARVSNLLDFSPLMLIWALIVINSDLFVENDCKMGYYAVYEKQKHFWWQPMCRKQFGQKISEVSSVQPAQTNERTANVVVDMWQTGIAYSSTWKRFQNRCEWSTCFHGKFSLWCRNRKGFVNVHLHCNVSNIKMISKMSTLPPWKNLCGRPWLL